ncbi:SDR family oxidoreductase [Elioraea rosea]|uniref:SDR family oxidoreductase n=1 Tax=Elioraea rosea TaxID=2492390 RepID=UPI0011835D88|nr:SDR family NAD(P)-dependent oxidoreductase [Elioraea rosea]
MIDLSGRTLVLTGAAGGIGSAIARLFRRAGARMLLADRAAPATLAVALDPTGEQVAAVACDVTDTASVQDMVAEAVARFSRIDIVVPNAGVFPDAALEGMTDTAWRECLAVNLDGTMAVCRAALPHMGHGGSIVTIASVAGHRGSRGHVHYAAAKGAVLSFTRSIASELAPRGIRANAVSPGVIGTAMVTGLMAERGEAILAQTPLRRLGRAEEVAGAVLFLASDLASFVTGETLHVNGGLYMHS